ncbi:hypothetical protein Dimus_020901 [Dionaea muscipula]
MQDIKTTSDVQDCGEVDPIDVRQKWEKLFKRRELVHVDAVKEFYAKLTMSHNRKKDVAKSKVRGVEIEFDHTMLASILGIPGNNGIYEYIKEVWEESKYTKPLEITRRFANDNSIMEARRVKSVEMKPFQRRRDNDDEVPEEEDEEEEKDQTEFDWEAVIDEAAEQGEFGSDDQFFDAQVEVEEPVTETPAASTVPAPSTVQQKVTKTSGVDPSCLTGRIPEAVMNKMQAEFERARANSFQADLEKAQAENVRLLALHQQAQTKPKP